MSHSKQMRLAREAARRAENAARETHERQIAEGRALRAVAAKQVGLFFGPVALGHDCRGEAEESLLVSLPGQAASSVLVQYTLTDNRNALVASPVF